MATLQTRAQAQDEQAVLAVVVADLAKRPKARPLANNGFDYPGFFPPPDTWLDNLQSTRTRRGDEVFAITVSVNSGIEEGWVTKDGWNWDQEEWSDRYKVLLVALNKQKEKVTWECGLVSEER